VQSDTAAGEGIGGNMSGARTEKELSQREALQRHFGNRTAMVDASEIGAPKLNEDLPDPLALARAEGALEEAKWWRHLAIMHTDSYFSVEGDKHIAFLTVEVARLKGGDK
jgi:hypothetical protein